MPAFPPCGPFRGSCPAFPRPSLTPGAPPRPTGAYLCTSCDHSIHNANKVRRPRAFAAFTARNPPPRGFPTATLVRVGDHLEEYTTNPTLPRAPTRRSSRCGTRGIPHRAEARERCASAARDARVRGRSHGHGEELREREDRHHRGVRPPPHATFGLLQGATTWTGSWEAGVLDDPLSSLMVSPSRRCANNRTPVPAVAIFDRPRALATRPPRNPPPPAHTKATDREKTFPGSQKSKRTRIPPWPSLQPRPSQQDARAGGQRLRGSLQPRR